MCVGRFRDHRRAVPIVLLRPSASWVAQQPFMGSNASELSLRSDGRSRTSHFDGLAQISLSLPRPSTGLIRRLDVETDRARQLFRGAEQFQALGVLIGTAGQGRGAPWRPLVICLLFVLIRINSSISSLGPKAPLREGRPSSFRTGRRKSVEGELGPR